MRWCSFFLYSSTSRWPAAGTNFLIDLVKQMPFHYFSFFELNRSLLSCGSCILRAQGPTGMDVLRHSYNAHMFIENPHVNTICLPASVHRMWAHFLFKTLSVAVCKGTQQRDNRFSFDLLKIYKNSPPVTWLSTKGSSNLGASAWLMSYRCAHSIHACILSHNWRRISNVNRNSATVCAMRIVKIWIVVIVILAPLCSRLYTNARFTKRLTIASHCIRVERIPTRRSFIEPA